ncbi:hypothetical protein BGZ65_009184 [Modicella reniformis]|uniref:Bromo domain-containing protein n=1 Tax=Modicella reniformis TaxID=1440133 RepID=A0A9P6MB31_9FUNG|nr:hypothetical protein BGZ65_009184 [Modicella reniformis]
MSDPSSTEIKSDSEPWSVLENLVLVQAIYKCGDTNWVAIARTIKGHPQIHRSSNFFSQKSCAIQYTQLLENLEAETRSKQSRSSEAGTSVTQDTGLTAYTYALSEIPSVVKLAGQLYNQRILEIKAMIRKDEERFRALVAELDEIRQGKWDGQLAEELKKKPSLASEAETGTVEANSLSTDSNQQQFEGEIVLVDITAPSTLSTPTSTSLSEKQEDTIRTVDVTGTEQSAPDATGTCFRSSEIGAASNLMDVEIEETIASSSTIPMPEESKDVPSLIPGAEDVEMEDVSNKGLMPAADHESSAPPIPQEGAVQSERVKDNTKPAPESQSDTNLPTSLSAMEATEEDASLAKGSLEASEDKTKNMVHTLREDKEQSGKLAEGDEIKEIKSEIESKEEVDERDEHTQQQKILWTRENHTEDGLEADEGSKEDQTPMIKTEETAIDPEHNEDAGHEGAEDGATSADEEETPSTPKSGRKSKKSKATIPAKRKRRSARGGGGGDNEEGYDSSDSETVDSVHTTMSDQLARTQMDDKKWKKILMMIWTDIANHRYGAVFMQPIKEQDAPGYYYMIKRPMDLKSIKERIRDGQITNADEFHRDVLLMFMNALMYNSEDTEVYQMALAMMTEVEFIIKNFKSSQSFAPLPASGAAGSGNTSSSTTPNTRTSGSEPSSGPSQPVTRKKEHWIRNDG